MKQILLTVAMLAIAVTAGAQNRDQLLSSIDKAKAATESEKKASNPNTWIKYGDALTKGFVALYGDSFRIGWNYTEVMLFNTQQPLSTEQKVVNGMSYTIQHYGNKDLYFNDATGILDAIVVTEPLSDENILADARDAYLKAAELDTKGSKKNALNGKLIKLRDLMVDNAYGYNAIGDYQKAAEYFEESLTCSENPVVNAIDSMIVYNTGLMYAILGNNDKAEKYYRQCVEIGYDVNGDVSSSLADILMQKGDVEGAKACLNEAFKKYPASQSILVSFINLCIESNDDPQKILDLIWAAQKNEPDNASLAYAEGNVYNSLGDLDNAVRCYEKSLEIDPNYVYGYYAIASAYIQASDKIVDEANALDIRDVEGYEKLMVEFENYLELAIAPYEKAFGMTDEVDIKESCASALKQIYFRFRDKDPKYAQGYEKYDSYLKGLGVE